MTYSIWCNSEPKNYDEILVFASGFNDIATASIRAGEIAIHLTFNKDAWEATMITPTAYIVAHTNGTIMYRINVLDDESAM